MSIFIYIFVMASVTYLIRMIPFTMFRTTIHSRFLRSVLFYIPYTVIAAMTIPAIFFSTGDVYTSLIGAFVAFMLAYFDCPLIVVALMAAFSAFLAGVFF
ncbi:MAG: AzlD domain-containing protein [Lachnospiraceae bacterium]|nr:AzlD domain-containing protein [Lachnospiraceae bacterium]